MFAWFNTAIGTELFTFQNPLAAQETTGLVVWYYYFSNFVVNFTTFNCRCITPKTFTSFFQLQILL